MYDIFNILPVSIKGGLSLMHFSQIVRVYLNFLYISDFECECLFLSLFPVWRRVEFKVSDFDCYVLNFLNKDGAFNIMHCTGFNNAYKTANSADP